LSGKAASTTKTAGGTTHSSSQEESAVLAHGITDVARQVNADYTLILTIGEPRYTVDDIPAQNGQPERLVFAAQPEVNCEIFQTRGHAAYRYNQKLERQMIETVEGVPGVG